MHLRIIQDQIVYPYALSTLLRNPGISFPRSPSPELLAEYGVFAVVATGQPAYDPATHKTVEVDPELVSGQWRQSWNIVALTAEELAARIPQSVSMRQARLALLGSGLLDTVNAALAAMTGVEGDAARIEWEYATEVRRDSTLVSGLTSTLGLTAAQLDQLFSTASTL